MTDAKTGNDTNSDAQMWQGRWENGQTGWDLNGPHPLLAQLMNTASRLSKLPNSRVFIPGCGRAHDGVALVRDFGMKVVAEDIAEGAISAAKALYSKVPELQLRVGNSSACTKEEQGYFGCIYDRAVLCALRPELRPPFVHACAERLAKGGLFSSLPFAETTGPVGSGPPFAISRGELHALFDEKFEVLKLDLAEGGAIDGKILAEWMFVARLR